MSNTNASYLARAIALEGERHALADDIKELAQQMKDAGCSKVEIKATKVAARRHYEDGKVADERVAVEAKIEDLLGEYADTDLGRAAIAVHVAGARVAV